jgi:hypothetical protein
VTDQPSESMSPNHDSTRALRTKMDVTTIIALSALAISGLSFYRSYIYKSQDLEITVTDVSYVTNQGGLYMGIAFSNGGNRDAAVLRVQPALWNTERKPEPAWTPLIDRVHPNIPLTSPKTPLVVKAGGVEIVTLSAVLTAESAERSALASKGGTFLGIRVATMNSDGNLYLLEHTVARLTLDRDGHVQGAEPAIHQTLRGFEDLRVAPPGDQLQQNKKTPFVWADQHVQ